MSDLDLKLYGQEITQLLQPGERLLAMTHFAPAPGKMRVELPPDPPDDRSGLQKAGVIALGVAAIAVDGPSPPSLSRMLGGVSAAGHAGSWTSRLLGARRGHADRTHYLAVTDLRLLLISKKSFRKDRDYSIDLVVPRNALSSASRHGRPFALGRVVIEFSDGSMIALKLGSVFTGQANRLVRALCSPGTSPPAPAAERR